MPPRVVVTGRVAGPRPHESRIGMVMPPPVAPARAAPAWPGGWLPAADLPLDGAELGPPAGGRAAAAPAGPLRDPGCRPRARGCGQPEGLRRAVGYPPR